MVKNFFEYIKELVPEKGSVFFHGRNHTFKNAISLYQLADLLCGTKIAFADDVTAYTWNVIEIWDYPFETMGLMFFFKDEDCERWIHFSKNAFFGAICIVATRNGIIFDDEEHEALRQAWARKLENKETEKDREITDREDEEGNFDDKPWSGKPDLYKRARDPESHIAARRERDKFHHRLLNRMYKIPPYPEDEENYVSNATI